MKAYDILKKAHDEGYAIGAFNVVNFETLKAVVQAAEHLRSPVIVETSEGETAFVTPRVIAAMVKAYRDKTNLPILLNLDHAHSFEAVEVAATAGYQLLHFDGSQSSYQKNVSTLKKVVEFAKKRGDLVEGEMDYIPGSSEPHLKEKFTIFHKQTRFTHPDKAQKFVQETKIDILAVFIGNVHGMYKNPPKLDFERLTQIRQKVNCFLSLHGGSGIPEEQIKKAIEIGKIVKINVNTELRLAYRQALEKSLKEHPDMALYKIMPPVVTAVQKVVEEKIKLFGSEGEI